MANLAGRYCGVLLRVARRDAAIRRASAGEWRTLAAPNGYALRFEGDTVPRLRMAYRRSLLRIASNDPKRRMPERGLCSLNTINQDCHRIWDSVICACRKCVWRKLRWPDNTASMAFVIIIIGSMEKEF